MTATRFAFLHVGDDTRLPALLTASIRKLHRAATIIQCADPQTPEVPGVDGVHRIAGDASRLMTLRLEAFATLPGEEPTLYLDTDMLCFSACDPRKVLGNHDVALCAREFGLSGPLNTANMGIDVSEYRDRPWHEVYPYVACATITRGAAFWRDCLQTLLGLDAKFQRWYGDQEALREVAKAGRYRVTTLPESVYGCLPEALAMVEEDPVFVHFKGPKRKSQMAEMARVLGLDELLTTPRATGR
jgi:hypothetical protein